MKKVGIVLATFLLATACQNNNSQEQNESIESEIKIESEVESTASTAYMSIPSLQDFTEYSGLMSVINIQDFIPKIKIDDDYKRVILFENNMGEQQYQSIFIKDEQRLKIVDFADNHQLFNDILQ